MHTFPTHMDHTTNKSLERSRTDAYDEPSHYDRLGTALEGLRLGESIFDDDQDKLTRQADGIQRNKQRWQTSSGWDELHTINESRRHSLAGELPTRRGSMAETHDFAHGDRLAFANRKSD